MTKTNATNYELTTIDGEKKICRIEETIGDFVKVVYFDAPYKPVTQIVPFKALKVATTKCQWCGRSLSPEDKSCPGCGAK